MVQENEQQGQTSQPSAQKSEENKAVKKKKTNKNKKRKRSKVGSFFMKWLFILFCLLASVVAGLLVGYALIGDGAPSDVFKIDTWKHIYDLVFS
ncbi:DNA-directed RNA polymerase subunit beta [Caldalkalibacillus salinus]|uniref:DNA-directed RNA polymerase subunit beta n=1 Tax=Caldalkalibacillus salinus TaxID=2803787 RepID=UPI001921FF75|nr:DNA-directed RNA polymerase subunit beta [Caldalkalibacillus salinus]